MRRGSGSLIAWRSLVLFVVNMLIAVVPGWLNESIQDDAVAKISDRRFCRHKYDAAHRIDAFSRRLWDKVDLEIIRRDLLTVVDQTMQPRSDPEKDPTYRVCSTTRRNQCTH